jgi:hypothetical protein
MATRKVDKHNMTNNKQQTAVDFAFETLANQGLLVYKEYTNLVAYQEAKEIEKERIENSYNAGYNNGVLDTCLTSKQYYNKTYGGGEQ